MSSTSVFLRATFLLTIGALLPFAALGASTDAQISGARLSSGARSEWSQRPFELLGGIGAGYASIIGQDYASAPHGGQYAIGLTGLYTFNRLSLEGGLGWMLSQVSGNDPQGRELSIRIRQATLDFGPRLRLGDRWRVGPIALTTFGTDTGYSPLVGDGLANVYVGAKASFRIVDRRLPVEAWAQAVTDVSISSRQMVASMIGVRIGFPLRAPASRDDSVRTGAAAPSRDSIGSRTEVRVVLDPGKVFFNTGSADVRPSVRTILLEAGHLLSQDADGWRTVQISGHADRRGSFAYNMMLSKERATSVERALVSGGADATRIKVEAHSYLKPADPASGPVAWARNRRVELVFTEVREPRRLLELLRPLTTQKPVLDSIPGKKTTRR